MIVKILMENLSDGMPGITGMHGLSYYIETGKHRLLMDTGPSPATWNNALTMGVDISGIDTVVLSHGHYDHCGGVLSFSEKNGTAPVFIRPEAFGNFIHLKPGEEKYIGIDPEIRNLPQIRTVPADYDIDENIHLFSNVTGRRLWPRGNTHLKKKLNSGLLVQDIFDHEQYLVITESGKSVLFSGCAHNGILNILDVFRNKYGRDPDAVFSGFHMARTAEQTPDDIKNIRSTAEELKSMNTVFYTGHCTGQEPFDIMKTIMGDRLFYAKCGDSFRI